MSLPSSLEAFQVHQTLVLNITGLNAHGDGIGHLDEAHPTVFVPNTVPGDRVCARVTNIKRTYAYAQLMQVLTPSPHRVRPACIVADKCGGCQWQAVDYAAQLTQKKDQVLQALRRIGKFADPQVLDVMAAPDPLGYRNKATYPLAWSPDRDRVKAGYYQRGTHKLINLNQCPIQDGQFNPLLAQLKQDIHRRGWSIYEETTHQGSLRHLSLRLGRRTGEMLITLVSCDRHLPQIQEQAQEWLERYPAVVGINLNLNRDRTNRIFGPRTETVAGRPYLREIFAGLEFQIQADTFFQIYTEQAEALVNRMFEALQLTGSETVIDAYCGIGTLTLPLAQRVKAVQGIEVHPESIRQAQENAQRNHLGNVQFLEGKVDHRLAEISQPPDLLLLDPPRKGCEGAVIDQIQRLQPRTILYLSCNPATLARDLQLLCQSGPYELKWVLPVDFFPQTAHIEALAYLSLETKHELIA
ncbi:23S rRNA (uracil(1939)-C(5))-methyltransferase RlmD [Lyngbya confervoides]|uniref:23S rRNA (Uracil(1939)-C(5))-methyltransferase RlmD n=1 Tax=Lyngbya confervoides BDU141951 TaxID=1574623 RepID=A0ABD4T9T8_9CYAN|nr:23S rRNA (uracil(1939)-C(5))-methyltransferase RlmD [Lyngbya confervoides]MCM1985213.1 23S rRNA (uracil(1939)-C(5))-methyltransferase RlmD [Lyngbya confervoides BDU141951]